MARKDAFLSYKSEDRAWAKRLVTAMEAANMSVFFDQKDLVAGQDWLPQLENGLEEAGALVVLWSRQAAQALTWSEQERYLFTRDEIRSPRLRRRPVIFVTLDEKPPVLSAEHLLTDLEETGLHAGGDPAAVSEEVWSRLATKIKRATLKNAIIVSTLVLAARQEDFTEVRLGSDRWQELQKRLEQLGLKDVFSARYGATPLDWRPHGRTTIGNILKEVEADLVAEEIPVHFDDVASRFTADDDAVRSQEARALSRQLALVIVDPFSLYVRRTERLLSSLGACYRSKSNAFAVLSPSEADDAVLNEHLRQEASDLYNCFFRPPIPYIDDQSSVGLNLRNRGELMRILRLAMSRHVRAPVTERPNPIIGGWGQ